MYFKKLKKLKLIDISTFLLCLFPLSLFLGNGPSEVIISSIGAIFLIHSANSNNFNWTKHTWVRLAVAFWGYICLRSLFVEQPLISLFRALPYIRFITFSCAIAFWIIPNLKNFRYLAYSAVFPIMFFGVSAITQFFLGLDFFGNQAIFTGDHLRLTSAAGKMNIGMVTLLIFFPAATYLFNTHRFYFLGYFTIAALTILLSGERTAFLFLLLGVFLLVASIAKYRVYLAYSLVALSILVSGMIYFEASVIRRQVISTYSEVSNFANTTYGRIYRISFEQFQSNPIFGIGLRHYQSECAKETYQPDWLYTSTTPKSYYCVTHPHNIYLEILSETGLIGFSLVLAMIYYWLKFVFHHRRLIINDNLKLGAGINLILKLVPIAASSSFFFAWSSAPLWYVVGIIYSTTKKAK